jgi:hypothetical protein
VEIKQQSHLKMLITTRRNDERIDSHKLQQQRAGALCISISQWRSIGTSVTKNKFNCILNYETA